MTDVRVVFVTLLRFYRWIGLGFLTAVVLVTVVGDVLLSRLGAVPYSLWMTVSANGIKYWLGVVAVMTVTMHLRPYVAAGLTRRAFLTGVAAFLLIAGLALSAIVVAGHAVEQAIVQRGGSYPVLTAAEFAHVPVTALAYAAGGAAISAGYYRFGWLRGLFLMVPAALPMLLAEGLLGLGPGGVPISRGLPIGLALTVTVVAIVLAVAMGDRSLRDTCIRRTTTV